LLKNYLARYKNKILTMKQMLLISGLLAMSVNLLSQTPSGMGNNKIMVKGKMEIIRTRTYYQDKIGGMTTSYDPMQRRNVTRRTETSFSNVSTQFLFTIDGVMQDGIGYRGENLEPYFKNCKEAMKNLQKMRSQTRTGNWAKIIGAVMVLPGGLMTGLAEEQKNKTIGIGLLAGGGILLITGLVEEKMSGKSLYRAAEAYNRCDENSKKTGWLKGVNAPAIAVASDKVIFGKQNIALKFIWKIRK
jgi:hypothetical protein